MISPAMDGSTAPQASFVKNDLVKRMARGIQEEMMVAMLSTLQTAARLCAEICVDRMQVLEAELTGQSRSEAYDDDAFDRRVSCTTFGLDDDCESDEDSSRREFTREQSEDGVSESRSSPSIKSSNFHLIRDPPMHAQTLQEDHRSTPRAKDINGPTVVADVTNHQDRHRKIDYLAAKGQHNDQVCEVNLKVMPESIEECAFCLGDEVMSKELVDTIHPAHQIPRGIVGEITRIDPEGNTCIKFEGVATATWVVESKLNLLMKAPIREVVNIEAALTNRAWSQFLSCLSKRMAGTDVQARFAQSKGARARWGCWLSFLAEPEEMKQVTEMRRTKKEEKFWPSELQDARSFQILEVLREMRVSDSDSHAMRVFETGIRQHALVHEFLAALTYQDLIMFSGPLRDIPLENLEIAWVLGIFPDHVEVLRDNGRKDLDSVAALRKEITQAISVNSKRGRRHSEITWEAPCIDPSRNRLERISSLDLSDLSQDELCTYGQRAIELLSLREIMDKCAEVWKAKAAVRGMAHRAIIASGLCNAELLLQQMREPPTADVQIPSSYQQCALNSTLLAMGLDPLPSTFTTLLQIKAQEHCGNIAIMKYGMRPMLVTAPHNIVLVRDGKSPQAMQQHTKLIADRIAMATNSQSLSWSRKEQYKTELSWALVKRRGLSKSCGDCAGLLDRRNRDPNNLETQELSENEWYKHMHNVRKRSKTVLVHLGVHGCRGPPDHPAHVNIGLGAMRQYMMQESKVSDAECFEQLRFLGQVLSDEVSESLRSLALVGGKTVSVIIPDDHEQPSALSGALPPRSDRHTQTQQAMRAGYDAAIHLELSMELRKALATQKEVCEMFGNSIWKAVISFMVQNDSIESFGGGFTF